MPSLQQRHGARGESAAAEYLLQLGYRLIARHATSRYGEIDIVARDGNELVFIEVRARRTGRFGTAEASIGPIKQRRLAAAIESFRNAHPELISAPYRCDVITIDPDRHPGLQHLKSVSLAP